ncbi:protein tramtrack, beta isoform-like isoform X5 [Homarus americanus]|uniref:protein tramtrack, beta isoform-like isoform X5 n=2 Tax=Homarus americanus TaxID=6706 RepID=UPI001C45FB9F|nr:protein tramtrack, beta isoform-like isoform X5 [Homarus americanus]
MGDHGMLLLSWNSHHATFCDILSRLRGKASFTDVTLACEGKFYPLHKLVLSTCSEYLEKIFESTPCKHPVIVLQDIKCSELEALINYMYVGEVNVPQSSLTSLIKAAELLQVKGLAVPDTPPSTSKKKLGAHEVSDDRVSPQAKRRKCEENTSSTGQKGRPPASNNSSPDTALHLKERRQTPVLESSRTHSSGSHQVSEQQQQHQSSEEPSLGHIEDVFVETDIKEELVEDLDDGNNLNASVPALDYQNQSSSYKAEDAGPDSEGDCGFSLPSDYNKQQPLEHQNILSHSTNVPDLPVNSSEIQGWMTEGRLDGELSVVEGYSGAGILDTSSPMITQQHGAPLHEQQMMELFGSSLISKSRGGYNRWTPEERLQIAKACTEMGPSKAARELSCKLNRKLSESTVRNIHKQYLRMVKKGQLKDNSSTLPTARSGRPRLHQPFEENYFPRY